MASSKIFLVASLFMALMFSSMITSSHAAKQLTTKQIKTKTFLVTISHNFLDPVFRPIPCLFLSFQDLVFRPIWHPVFLNFRDKVFQTILHLSLIQLLVLLNFRGKVSQNSILLSFHNPYFLMTLPQRLDPPPEISSSFHLPLLCPLSPQLQLPTFELSPPN